MTNMRRGIGAGLAAPVMTLMLPVIYGAVLGFAYAKLDKGTAKV